jgi:flagellin-like hook-associated protein FlgL
MPLIFGILHACLGSWRTIMNTIPHNVATLNASTPNGITGNITKTTEHANISLKTSHIADIPVRLADDGNLDADIQITDQGRRSAYVQTESSAFTLKQIRDANIADEIINLAKSQVLNQSGPSALGQINQDAQALLGLLK